MGDDEQMAVMTIDGNVAEDDLGFASLLLACSD
jgi:hypothetical protein